VIDGLVAVAEAAGALKGLRRAGWVRRGIAEPESVAAHCYRVALLARLVGPRLGLDVEKLLTLALLHDLAEARVGDLTPADEVAPAEKSAREVAAFAAIVGGLPEGARLLDLFEEYEHGASPEARLVREIDRLEMAMQALEYERAYGRDLDEFWVSARAALSEPLMIEIYDHLWAARPGRKC
jgi:putative hydrolase of HD superfamily